MKNKWEVCDVFVLLYGQDATFLEVNHRGNMVGWSNT